MKLLIVTPEYPPHVGGGILRYYQELVPSLAARGIDVTVLVAAPFSPDFEDYAAEGVAIRCLPGAMTADVSRSLPQFSAAGTFRGWVAASVAAGRWARDAGPFDLVEVTDFGLGFVSFLVDGFPAPVIARLHGSLGQIAVHEPVRPAADLDSALARLTESALLGRAADLQTYSRANAADWQRELGRDVEFLPAPVPTRPGSTTPGDYALVAGRIQSWKGAELLCRALARIDRARRPPVTWVGRDTATAPGGGSYDAYLRDTFPDLWGRHVEVLEQRPFEAVQALIGGARVVVCPSEWDVFNLTVAEAMARGRVVVCSDGAGASELVDHGRNGLVFNRGDAEALAACLDDAFGWPADRLERMGEHARQTVAERLDPREVAARWVARAEVIQSQASPPNPAPAGVRAFYAVADRPVHTAFLEQVGGRQITSHLGRRAWQRLKGGGPG